MSGQPPDAKLPHNRVHDLRHFCASLLLAQGVPLNLYTTALLALDSRSIHYWIQNRLPYHIGIIGPSVHTAEYEVYQLIILRLPPQAPEDVDKLNRQDQLALARFCLRLFQP